MFRPNSSSFNTAAVVILLIFFFHLALSTAPSFPPPPRRSRNLVTKLTHYQSFDSPFYNASISASKASLIDLENSIARAAYLTSTPNYNTTILHPNDDLEAPVSSRPPNGGFLAHIQVGSKLLDQLVLMDTGSALLWIYCCQRCGSDVLRPVFVPRESSTFHNEHCSRGFCSSLTYGCRRNTCYYKARYAKGEAEGYFARDSIKFKTSEDILPEIGFGCTTKQTGGAQETNGVLGLGNSPISLPSQMQATHFAYCFGNFSDKDYPHNKLIVGKYIGLVGSRTPIIVDGKYFLNLEAIKFDNGSGSHGLDFDAGILKRNLVARTGGMILDTGSTYTFLPQVVVEKIEAEIMSVIGTSLTRSYGYYYLRGNYSLLCYGANLFTGDMDWFPNVVFEFQGYATLVLSYYHMFRPMDERTFCLAILPSYLVEGLGTQSLLGITMQQYYYFQCDISQKILSFYKMDCAELEDDNDGF